MLGRRYPASVPLGQGAGAGGLAGKTERRLVGSSHVTGGHPPRPLGLYPRVHDENRTRSGSAGCRIERADDHHAAHVPCRHLSYGPPCARRSQRLLDPFGARDGTAGREARRISSATRRGPPRPIRIAASQRSHRRSSTSRVEDHRRRRRLAWAGTSDEEGGDGPDGHRSFHSVQCSDGHCTTRRRAPDPLEPGVDSTRLPARGLAQGAIRLVSPRAGHRQTHRVSASDHRINATW